MSEKIIGKVGYFTIKEVIENGQQIFVADNGKLVYSKRFKKYYPNKNYIVKKSKDLSSLKKTLKTGMKKSLKKKEKVLKKLPKILYLVIFDEKSTNKKFVKVGFTTKKLVSRRFSTEYGYEGYVIFKVLRKFNDVNADKLESRIKTDLNKHPLIKKYRPVLKEFSGYSECYSFDNMELIMEIFDRITKKVIK